MILPIRERDECTVVVNGSGALFTDIPTVLGVVVRFTFLGSGHIFLHRRHFISHHASHLGLERYAQMEATEGWSF